MPLTRANLTASSKVMLQVYPTFSLLVGLSYTFGAPTRTASPAFDVVRSMMPLHYWGMVFLVLTAGMLGALATKNRRAMVLMLCTALGFYSAWTAGFVLSLLDLTHGVGHIGFREDIPLTSVWLWSFVCAAHVASLRSLTRDVVLPA